MKAAVFHGPNQPLKIEEVETPKINQDEILVKIKACGVCNTDLHYIDHGVPTFKKPPMILGHEPSGVVAEVGSEVKNFKEGDLVLIPPVFSCGYCPNCRLGRENICFNMLMLGNHIDGAYAEYTKAPAKDCQHLPEDFPLEESSIIADAISTPYHAVKNRAQVKPGDSVIVFGCGGVGINVVQMAAASGGSVIAVDIVDKKLEIAKQLGAQHTINAKDKEDKVLDLLAEAGIKGPRRGRLDHVITVAQRIGDDGDQKQPQTPHRPAEAPSQAQGVVGRFYRGPQDRRQVHRHSQSESKPP